jgi:hypothetical protein
MACPRGGAQWCFITVGGLPVLCIIDNNSNYESFELRIEFGPKHSIIGGGRHYKRVVINNSKALGGVVGFRA